MLVGTAEVVLLCVYVCAHECMCVYAHVRFWCVYVYVYTYMHAYVCTYLYMYNMYVCVHVCVHACTCVWLVDYSTL